MSSESSWCMLAVGCGNGAGAGWRRNRWHRRRRNRRHRRRRRGRRRRAAAAARAAPAAVAASTSRVVDVLPGHLERGRRQRVGDGHGRAADDRLGRQRRQAAHRRLVRRPAGGRERHAAAVHAGTSRRRLRHARRSRCRPAGTSKASANYDCSGGDCHLIVYQGMRLYELYQAQITGGMATGGTFSGTCLVVWDLTKDYWANPATVGAGFSRGDGCNGADAADVPMAALILKTDGDPGRRRQPRHALHHRQRAHPRQRLRAPGDAPRRPDGRRDHAALRRAPAAQGVVRRLDAAERRGARGGGGAQEVRHVPGRRRQPVHLGHRRHRHASSRRRR